MADPTPKTFGFNPAQVAQYSDPNFLAAQRAQSARSAMKAPPPAPAPEPGLTAEFAPGTMDPAEVGVPPEGMDVGSPNMAALEGEVEGEGIGWKEGMDAAQIGAGGVGGVLEALGAAGAGESAYNLPGAGGADKMDLAGVGSPFRTGKMKAPDRQSLALALLR